MPNSLQTLDTSFPKIDDHQTTEENFLQVTNYLYMLLENLRYTLGNLGEENFNDTELDDIAKMIREPVWASIEDAEGNINSLNITANSLSSQISDINGNVSSLTHTSQTLISRIQTAEGDISSLIHTAQSLSSEIKSVGEGVGTKITQSINGISLSAENGEGNSSTLKLMYNGTVLSSPSITFNGLVTFTDLSTINKKTVINGGNITTGYLSADRIDGGTLTGVTFIAKGTPSSGLRNITIEDGEIRVGDTVLCEDTDGHTQLSNYEGSISISCPYYINLSGGLGVTINRLVMDNGKYWVFSSSGIGFYDASGTPISHVQLASGAP